MSTTRAFCAHSAEAVSAPATAPVQTPSRRNVACQGPGAPGPRLCQAACAGGAACCSLETPAQEGADRSVSPARCPAPVDPPRLPALTVAPSRAQCPRASSSTPRPQTPRRQASKMPTTMSGSATGSVRRSARSASPMQREQQRSSASNRRPLRGPPRPQCAAPLQNSGGAPTQQNRCVKTMRRLCMQHVRARAGSQSRCRRTRTTWPTARPRGRPAPPTLGAQGVVAAAGL